jgi:23S rRNA (uridine2552-2'-O)-methyltransferase
MRKWNDDPFTKKARKENYEARSIYKLSEIDKKERIIGANQCILDLGASPGSWTQYCLEKIKQGKIVAVDISPINVSDPRLVFLQESIETADIASHLAGGKADVVLSDMAPKTSGIPDRDIALSLELAGLALNTARAYLKPGGDFIVKVFMGHDFEQFNAEMKKSFSKVRLLRPESVRKQSREIYLIGRGFKA